MSRYEEEDFLANLIHTYAAEIHEARNLHPEEFTEPHLGEIWEKIRATQKPNWDYTALTDLEVFKTLSPKARETLTYLVANGNGNPQKIKTLAYQIKAEARLLITKKLRDLHETTNLENQESRLEEAKKLMAILEAPIQLEAEEDQTGRAINWINALQKEPDYLATNSPSLNSYIDGFTRGRFYVLAARPSIGKTAVALNLAWGVKDKKVAFYSLEMTEAEILGVVCHVRYDLSGADPTSEEWAAEYETWCSPESEIFKALESGSTSFDTVEKDFAMLENKPKAVGTSPRETVGK